MERGRRVRAVTSRIGAARLVALGVASGLLYVAMYASQRAIHAGPGSTVFAGSVALYLVITIGVFGLYAWVLVLCRRQLTGAARLAAWAVPVVVSVMWLPVAPVFSIDVFSYIAHGYIQVELGDNPYLVSGTAVAASPIGQPLIDYGWRPVHPATPYGPVMTDLETAIVWLAGDNVRLSMVLFKLVAVASSLGVAAVIWMIVDRVRPRDRDIATIAYLWNPAVLVETAGEGHNDSVMTVLAVVTVLLVLQRRVVLGALTMAAAVLTKYVPVLLIPVLLGYLWRNTADKRPLLFRIAAGAVAAVCAAVALYVPYWAGRQTFTGLVSSGRAGHTGSTQTFLVEILATVIGGQPALRVVSLFAAATVMLAAIAIAMWVRTPTDLLQGIAVLMVIYTLLAPAYWPWYIVMPVAFLAMSPHGTLLVLLVAMSLGSRIVAPLDSLYVDGVIGRPAFFLLTWLGSIAVPLIAVLVYHRGYFAELVSKRIRQRYRSCKP